MKPTILKSSHRRPTGFTLTELLVVIVIIVVLAAATFPLVKNGIRAAQKTTAINQIRQISSLAVAYAIENNGILPDEGGEGLQSFSALRTKTLAWYNVLPPMAGIEAGG